MALFGFENSLGWLAFTSLVPFLLIYLIRPKPKELAVPSLMFFTRSLFSDKERSFLRKFTSDWLFFLQLLILLLLSAFFVGPYATLKEGVFLEHVVIVLDTSASMKADHERLFEKAVDKAEDLLGGQNTIILVSNYPKIALEEASEEEALQFLRSLKATDTRSNIGDAVVLAGGYAKGENPVVYVISDFIGTEGANVDVAINSLKTKGITVNLINVYDGKMDNVGIVDVNAGEETTQVLIKNFGENQERVNLKINGLGKELVIGPKSIETFSFRTPNGMTEIQILHEDDFPIDDRAFVFKPADKKIKVLLVSNDPSIYLTAALTASKDIVVETSEPPIIPSKDYDVYIVDDVNQKLLITGLFEKIKEKVERGAGLVVHAQEDSDRIDYKGLLALSLGEKKKFGALIVDQVNRFTREIEFGNVDRYFTTREGKESPIVSADNSSIVALYKLGNGRSVYYGILEDASDFKLSPSYPVFWVNLVKFLADVGEVHDLNVPTGTILTFENKIPIKTPSRAFVSDLVTLDEVGIYEIGAKVYAASLMSEAESDVNGLLREKDFREKLRALESAGEVKRDLSAIIIVIVLVLLLLETLAVKMRGDL